MKRKIAAFIILILLAAAAGCGKADSTRPPVDSVESYLDVPGVTEETTSDHLNGSLLKKPFLCR